MNCPHCGEEIAGASIVINSVPERDKPEIKYSDVQKMYEQMPPIEPRRMNDESYTYNYPSLGVFDCVDGI